MTPQQVMTIAISENPVRYLRDGEIFIRITDRDRGEYELIDPEDVE